MRETSAGTAMALGQALLLHGVLFALLSAGLWWTRSAAPTSAAAGPIVEVDLIGPGALSMAIQQALRGPATSPPEPLPVEEAAVSSEPPVPHLDNVQPAAQEGMSGPDVSEHESVEGIAASAEPGSPPEADQQAMEQVFGDRRQRVLALRRANRARQTFEQTHIAGASNAAGTPMRSHATVSVAFPRASDDADAALLARYEAQLQDMILDNWIIPATMPVGQPCRVIIEQSPDGEVLDLRVDETCPFDETGRRSLVDAVMDSQPLPHKGFEAVLYETLVLDFEGHDR